MQVSLLYVLWVVVLFDPQWLVAWYGPDAVLRVPVLLFALMGAVVLFRVPRQWCVPILLFLCVGLVTAPFTYDLGKSLTGIKPLILYYVLAVATMRLVETPRQLLPILSALFLTQFVWWGLWGTKAGLVPWHFQYNNYDAFGPLMVIGAVSTFYYALAVSSRRVRLIAFGTAALCVMGLVSSFARGAVVAAAVVVGYMWFRSKKKAVMAGAIVAGFVVVLVSSSLLFVGVNRGGDTEATFFAEMATISRDQNAGTGQDRKELWKAAWLVFLDNPVLGAGVENFGPYAAEHIQAGQVGGAYSENPRTLYERALHSSYAQILSEMGAVGSALFLWLLVDFWRRNGKLREPRAMEAWAASGTGVDLLMLSYALEGSMLAYLGTAFFYNQLWNNWLWSIVIVNMLLYQLTHPSGAPAVRPARLRARASARPVSTR